MDVGRVPPRPTPSLGAEAELIEAVRAAPVIGQGRNSTYLRHVASTAPAGAALEFGVHKGHSLRAIRDARKPPVFGFDCWTGLPERWDLGEGLSVAAGVFATEPPTDLPHGVSLVSGLFEESLPAWLAGKGAAHPIAFVHVDCDLYSSTVTVLTHVVPRLKLGAVVAFDELVQFDDSPYVAWREGEWRALIECIAATGARFTPIARTTHEQVAFRFDGFEK
jgi:hypothetical protein